MKDMVEITAKVNGEEVLLDTISVETFQKVKETVKINEASVHIIEFEGRPRVLFKVTDEICSHRGKVIVLKPNGEIINIYNTFTAAYRSSTYNNIKKLGE